MAREVTRALSPVSGRSAPTGANRTGASPATAKTWLVLQGDVIDEVQGAEPPDLTTRPGERRKRILGAATTAEELEKLRGFWSSRARGITGRGEAY